jgi:hypothetical protein
MEPALVGAVLIPPIIDAFFAQHPTVLSLVVWAVGMLSYHQDAKHHDPSWTIFSQTLAIVGLTALVVFGFTHKSWPNFVIAPPLIWLHFQFTKRWWAKPGAWW